MAYTIKEIYYTIQGEGRHTGRPMIFCRFAGCNLWNGREQDRMQAVCKFCDTDFIGTDGANGGKYDSTALVEKILTLWPKDCGIQPAVVFTGGEPALQIDETLIAEMKKSEIYIAVETNGTIPLPDGLDWICVSPKGDAVIKQKTGNELKLVYPQPENQPKQFEGLDFKYFYLQPLEDEFWIQNTAAAVEYVKSHPKWRLSVQTHKYINIP
ncbi:MAG: 7-carboxy-7-deazaguanine synthase [Saprospiraceae bacterium]|nr:MAG: 7-carboxy-7-deazaguanine synthase [Candidatus Parvibacillus calidus]MBX2936455.1 7-carboxy-7-deazaguanine synthase [Saprospiraceae bacterium]MBK7739268.1 7-carboxy-7-deazaguanine synthase [Candidatus Parvibacillus calidus]MBX7180161.1 7-carboxy-7-deazaguanine synthase [Saprospiraceae bacterium]MCB0592111.1 7-carboxy-7-deazaguanine synthase [Saprospiraceae bacterium]